MGGWRSSSTSRQPLFGDPLMFPVHSKFPKEMAVIGRILLDYGELELDLMNCIQVARKYDMNSTLKAMFRIRGEMSRIQIADALGRVPYATVGLEPAALDQVSLHNGDAVLDEGGHNAVARA